MTREFFDNNAIMVVEVEYEDGGRFRNIMKGSEVKAYIDNLSSDEYVSDIDYCARQDNREIAEILDKAWKLLSDKSYNFKSLEDAINSLMDNPKKVWTEEEIKNLIQTNDKVLYGALKKLYVQQTANEQVSSETKERNGKGFNSVDAHFLTSVTQFYLRTGYLTAKQKFYARKKLIKYNKQLTRLANAS